MNGYSNVGAGWEKENGSISVKLGNGEYITLWPNKDKKPGSKQPDFRATAKTEVADSLGIEEKREQQPGPKIATAEGEIDLSDLPF